MRRASRFSLRRPGCILCLRPKSQRAPPVEQCRRNQRRQPVLGVHRLGTAQQGLGEMSPGISQLPRMYERLSVLAVDLPLLATQNGFLESGGGGNAPSIQEFSADNAMCL